MVNNTYLSIDALNTHRFSIFPLKGLRVMRLLRFVISKIICDF